jgi:hypothetical protein
MRRLPTTPNRRFDAPFVIDANSGAVVVASANSIRSWQTELPPANASLMAQHQWWSP